MKLRRRKVFVSATSLDLRSYRVVAENVLLRRGYLPVTNDTLPTTVLEIREKLRQSIGGCQAAICIMGEMFGSEPHDRGKGEPRRSYTQMEYDLARELRKPTFLLVSAPAADFDPHPPEPAELGRLQAEFRAAAIKDRDWESFTTRDDLRAAIENIRFPWERLLLSRRALGGIAAAAAVALLTAQRLAPAKDRFAEFEGYLDLPTTLPPDKPSTGPPQSVPSMHMANGKEIRTGERGPRRLVFQNDSQMDVVVVFLERRSMRYRSRVIVHRNGTALAPGGKDIRDYCYFVARTPDKDYPLGWKFLYDVNEQTFTIADDGTDLKLCSAVSE